MGALFIVHPIEAQRLLAERIHEHWVEGSGKRRIPDRAAAMELLRVVPALDDALRGARRARGDRGVDDGRAPRAGPSVTTYAEARERLAGGRSRCCSCSGRAGGSRGSWWRRRDARLEPIRARAETGYNHLSVRAACAITLDRLLG